MHTITTSRGKSQHLTEPTERPRFGTARKMSVDIDATSDLLLLIQQKLRIMQHQYSSFS